MPDQYYCENCGRLTPIKEEKCFDCGGNMLKAGEVGDESERDDGKYTDEELGTPMDEDMDMPDEADSVPKAKSSPANQNDDDF